MRSLSLFRGFNLQFPLPFDLPRETEILKWNYALGERKEKPIYSVPALIRK